MKMEWLYAIVVSSVLALQGWILLEIIGLKVTLSQHDQQIKRVVSDQESEKGTRKRSNDDFEGRLRVLERHHE